MSDGFDKEAEREKLREKYADDEQKREHTQRMSELLLKGATMTNRHCEECGDPIFRHDGREFCPTCGSAAGGDVGSGSTGAEAAGADEAADAAAPTAESGVDAAAENGVAGSGTADSGAAEGRQPESPPSATVPPRGSSPQEPPSPQESPPQASDSTRDSAPQRSGREAAESPQSNPSRSATDADGLGAARASLTRTLTRFARAAEETDDPRRARDHLEAAREAAEALAALD